MPSQRTEPATCGEMTGGGELDRGEEAGGGRKSGGKAPGGRLQGGGNRLDPVCMYVCMYVCMQRPVKQVRGPGHNLSCGAPALVLHEHMRNTCLNYLQVRPR